MSWTPPSSDSQLSVSSYSVVPSPSCQSCTGLTTNGSSTQSTVSGLTQGTTYTFTVSASNAAGPSPTGAAASYSVHVTLPFNGLFEPKGIAVDADGDVFVVNSGDDEVVGLSKTSGGYSPQSALPFTGLSAPDGVAVDVSGDVFVANTGNDEVFELPNTGDGYGPQVTLPFTGLSAPDGVAVDVSGDVFVANTGDDEVFELPNTGDGYGPQVTLPFIGLSAPGGVAVDGAGDVFATSDTGAPAGQVLELPRTAGGYGSQVILPLTNNEPTLGSPLAVDASGNVFVDSDTFIGSDSIGLMEIPVSGNGYGPQVTLLFGGDTAGLAVDGNGDVFITNESAPASDAVSELVSGTVEGATSPSGVTLTSSPLLGGTLSTYATSFTATTTAPSGGDIFVSELDGPTNFSTESSVLVDDTTAGWQFVATGVVAGTSVNARATGLNGSCTVGTPNCSASGALEIPLADAIEPDDAVTVTMDGVTNPGAGTYNDFEVSTSADIAPASATPYTIEPGTLFVTTSSTAAATAGQPYSQALTAAGGSGRYSWSVLSGALPPGLELSLSNGTISGIPSTAGTYNFTAEVMDSTQPAPQAATGAFSITVSSVPPGSPTDITVVPGNASAEVGWEQPDFDGGSAITGYNVYADGTKVMSAAQNATSVEVPNLTDGVMYAVTVAATNGDSTGAPSSPAVEVTPMVQPLVISVLSLSAASVGTAYSAALTATGGLAPYSWSLESGALPPGLSLSTGGVISGTPTTAGGSEFTISVADASSQNASSAAQLNVAGLAAPAITGLTPASGPPAGGGLIVVAGSGFSTSPGQTSFWFGSGDEASGVVCPLTGLCVATIPPHAAGDVDVTATVNGLQSSPSTEGAYDYAGLSITEISPAVGPIAGGTTLAITGTGFATTPGGTQISFGGASVSEVSCPSTTTCTLTTPPGATGTVGVTADVNGETAEAPTDFSYEGPSVPGLHVVFNPTPFVPPADLTAGETVSFMATAVDASGEPVPDTSVYLEAPTPVSDGTFTVGTTLLSSTPQPFMTDANGNLGIVYTAPNPLPSQAAPSIDADITPAEAPWALDYYLFQAPPALQQPPTCTPATCGPITVDCTQAPTTDPESCPSPTQNYTTNPDYNWAIQTLEQVATQEAQNLPCVSLVVDGSSFRNDLNTYIQDQPNGPGGVLSVIQSPGFLDALASLADVAPGTAVCATLIGPEGLVALAVVGASAVVVLVAAPILADVPLPVVTVNPGVCPPVPLAATEATLKFSPIPIAPAGTLAPGTTVPFTLTVAGQNGDPVPGSYNVYLSGSNSEDGSFSLDPEGQEIIPDGWETTVPAGTGQIPLYYTTPSFIPSDGSFPAIEATLCPPGLPQINVSGFESYSQMQAQLFPSLVQVAAPTADANGDAQFSVDLPPSTGNGPETIEITGTSPSLQPVTQFVTITQNIVSTFGGDSSGLTASAAPEVAGVTPPQGSTGGGEVVSIQGTNLNDATSVDFGDPSAIGFTIESPSLILAVAPPGSGTVDVRVGTSGGVTQTSSEDQFEYIGSTGTSITLAPSTGPVVVGQPVTYMANVAPTAPTSDVPTGIVTFDDGTFPVDCGPGSLGFDGASATCAVTYTGVGAHKITASYLGDSNFASSTTGSVLGQTVNEAQTTTIVSSSVNPSAAAQAVTLTATVGVLSPGSGNPTGNVEFLNGGTAITSCGATTGEPLVGTDATCNASFISTGTDQITATYLGDPNFFELDRRRGA